MVTGGELAERAKEIALAASGYVFGAETQPGDRGKPLDCSELVEQTGAELRIKPRVPDGSSAQRAHCLAISVARAFATPGALLFKKGHVAISNGDGTTTEARSRRSGVGVYAIGDPGDWLAAGLLPGVVYSVFDERPVLWLGMPADEDVATLAKALNRWAGKALLSGSGPFGPKTQAAVKSFQAKAGLKVDGIVGPRTWAALEPWL